MSLHDMSGGSGSNSRVAAAPWLLTVRHPNLLRWEGRALASHSYVSAKRARQTGFRLEQHFERLFLGLVAVVATFKNKI